MNRNFIMSALFCLGAVVLSSCNSGSSSSSTSIKYLPTGMYTGVLNPTDSSCASESPATLYVAINASGGESTTWNLFSDPNFENSIISFSAPVTLTNDPCLPETTVHADSDGYSTVSLKSCKFNSSNNVLSGTFVTFTTDGGGTTCQVPLSVTKLN